MFRKVIYNFGQLITVCPNFGLIYILAQVIMHLVMYENKDCNFFFN